jgi:hypothetical protein
MTALVGRDWKRLHNILAFYQASRYALADFINLTDFIRINNDIIQKSNSTIQTS